MIGKLLTVSAAVSALFFSSMDVAEAATIQVERVTGNPYDTAYGIRDNTGTNGRDLDGAQIQATFSDGTTEDVTWEADPAFWTNPDGSIYYSNRGYAVGSDFDLRMSWDGFELSTTRLLTSISIDLTGGNSVFDTTYIFDNDPNGGSTPTSSFGYEFELYDEFLGLAGDIDVTYSNIVSLAGAPPAGDLFTTMLVDFTGLDTGGILGDVNFRSDMDTLRYAGDLTLTPVPLPASLPLVLVGLAGFAGLRRSKRKT